jgi:hypothetical protein
VKDPTRGQATRRLASPLGVVRVIEVDEVSAVAVAGSGSGDVVKSTPK